MITKRRIPRVSRMALPILVIFIILTLTVGMFTSLMFKMEHLQRISRGYYSTEAVFFVFPQGSTFYSDKNKHMLDVESETDYLIISAINDTRVLFYKGEITAPPVLEGRFFTPEETADPLPLAVVGADRWDEVTIQGGKQTIEEYGQTFTVIGKMGTKTPNVINSFIMVNYGAVPQAELAAGRLYVDGQDPESVFKGIQQKSNQIGISAPTRLEQPSEAIDVVIRRYVIGRMYLSIIVAVMILGSAILMVEWIRSKIHTIAVYRLVGFSSSQICMSIIREYMLYAVVGIGIALTLMLILNNYNIYVINSSFVKQALTVSGACLCMGLGITVPALLRAIRVDVVRILR